MKSICSEMRLFPEAVGRLLSHTATCYFPPHRVTIQPFELYSRSRQYTLIKINEVCCCCEQLHRIGKQQICNAYT